MTNGTLTRLRGALALCATVFVGACESEPTTPQGEPRVVAEVVGPGPIFAAVVDFDHVADVTVRGGEVFLAPHAGGVRAVIVLHEPGTMLLTLSLDETGEPAATLLDVADGAGTVPATFDGYEVVVDA